jgi:hypothetical protein
MDNQNSLTTQIVREPAAPGDRLLAATRLGPNQVDSTTRARRLPASWIVDHRVAKFVVNARPESEIVRRAQQRDGGPMQKNLKK